MHRAILGHYSISANVPACLVKPTPGRHPTSPNFPAFKKVARALILQMACEYLQQCSCRSHRGLLEGMVGASHNLSTTLACSPHNSQQRKLERGSQLPGTRHPDFRHILTAVALQHPAEKVTFLFERLFKTFSHSFSSSPRFHLQPSKKLYL